MHTDDPAIIFSLQNYAINDYALFYWKSIWGLFIIREMKCIIYTALSVIIL